MALIKCFECGKEVSNTAKQCPHCGFEIKKKLDELKAGKGCAILIVGLAILHFNLLLILEAVPLSSSNRHRRHDFNKQKKVEIKSFCSLLCGRGNFFGLCYGFDDCDSYEKNF